jgi:hypothetical protein
MLGAGFLVGVAIVVAVVTPAARAQERAPHDPLQGMDPSGRIPKVELPEDLAHPERWRYIPEGRIKPGNIFQRFLVSSFVAPQFFFEGDIGAGAGIALTDIDFREQRRREFLGAFASYTTEGQQKYRLIWRRWLEHRDLPQGGVIVEERNHLDAFGGYEKSLTRRFFGLGPDTRERDETSFTDEVLDIGARADFAVPSLASNWIATLGARGEHHDLAPGKVSDHPTTNEVFPQLFRDANHHDAFIVTTGLRYDTRDSQHQPYSGFQAGILFDAPLWQSGGKPGMVATVFGNVAFRVPPLFHRGGDRFEENPPTDTIALRLETETTAGDLPFYSLPSLGGNDRARGFIEGRFRDRSLWAATAEYRFWVIPRGFALSPWTPYVRVERLGLALFYDVGSVGDEWWDLFSASPKHSGGIGFRCTLERNAPFRVDVGFSDEGPQVTAGFGLSF